MVEVVQERCSLLATRAQEPLIGTASRNAFHFVMAVPKREWLPAIEEMDAPAGVLARLIKPLKDQAVVSLTCTPEEHWGSIWVFPHSLRFDHVQPEQYPILIEQVMSGHIHFPYEEVAGTTILQCTHGKRDQCCATHGRTMFAALQEHAPAGMRVWEVSHLGGHRFAATLVIQPTGHWYGNLRPDDAPSLIEAIQNREVLLDHYRGNASYPPPLQVAEKWGWEQLQQQGRTGKINLVNPQVAPPHAQVEVSLDVDGIKQHYRLGLESESYDFVADCSGNMKDRLIWQIVSMDRYREDE